MAASLLVRWTPIHIMARRHYKGLPCCARLFSSSQILNMSSKPLRKSSVKKQQESSVSWTISKRVKKTQSRDTAAVKYDDFKSSKRFNETQFQDTAASYDNFKSTFSKHMTDNKDMKRERKFPPAELSVLRKTKTDVPSVLVKSHPQLGSSNYLYVFVIREAASGELFSRDQGIGLLTTKCLPHLMVPQYSLYVKDTPADKEIELTVTVQVVSEPFSVDANELNIYRNCHHGIFTSILSLQALVPDFENADRDYIVVPVTINSTDAREVFIDFVRANSIATKVKESGQKHEKEISVEESSKSLVCPVRRDHVDTGIIDEEIYCSSFLRVLRCLPAVLWRMESLLLADELAENIRKDTGIGKLTSSSILLTDTAVKCYKDAAFGELPSKILKVSSQNTYHVSEIIPPAGLSNYYNRGPDSGLILQALTPRRAHDLISLGRLAILGDSFLKLATSVCLFNTKGNDLAHKLSRERSWRTSNTDLFRLGKIKNIDSKIMSRYFNMHGEGSSSVRWIPPGYALPTTSTSEEEQLKCHPVNGTNVASTVEALIGAHTVAGGLEGGIAFMKWIGVKLEVSDDKCFDQDYPVTSASNLFFVNSDQIFKKHFGNPPVSSLFAGTTNEKRDHILTRVAKVQKKINYNYKNKLLLIEAMTHPKCRNSITVSNRRLAFLGDAILNYLVTCHICICHPKAEPVHMIELQDSVTCLSQISKLALSLGFDETLLHDSPRLSQGLRNCRSIVLKKQRSQSHFKKLSGDLEKPDVKEAVSLNPLECLGDCFKALAGGVFIDSDMDLQKVWQVFSPVLVPLLIENAKGPSSSNQVKEM